MWIAIDYGKVCVGLAVSGPCGLTTAPAGTLHYPGKTFLRGKSFIMVEAGVRNLLEERGGRLQGIVLGDPGEEDEGSRYLRVRIRALGALLARVFEVPVFYQDEAFSSREAEDGMKASGVRNRSSRLDAVAACVILRRFLDSGVAQF